MNRRFALTAIAALLAGCGGGGTSQGSYVPPATTVLRTDLLFGYYLTGAGQWQATKDHVNLMFEGQETGALTAAASMREHGQRTMLNLSGLCYDGATFRPLPDAAVRVRGCLQTLKDAGVLSQVIALYPLDEPDQHGLNDAEVTAMCGVVRSVASEFHELANVKLAVIYTDRIDWPGFAAHDCVAIDPYDHGSDMFVAAPFLEMKARLAPHQSYFLVPGGGDPWRQDPEPYRRVAQADPRCVGILAFLYITRFDSTPPSAGIGTNGMLAAYRAVGLEFSQPRKSNAT